MFILRSLLLPIVAVLLNLLTVAAAFGALRVIFQGENPIGGGPGYLDTLALTGTFTVIFALSIDYQLFLLARMREGYERSHSVEESVTHAITHTGGVILGAAAVMIAVFAAFGLGEFVTIRQLGVGLTVAIVLDATVIRLLILPAVVRLLGHRAWWFPGAEGPRRTQPLPVLADHGAVS
jgi:RND superfamily putative drug exporter